jgi:uncharacterized damage-inducible protein DinB
MNVRPKSSNDPAALRQERAEAISAIEGQILTDEQRRRINAWEKSGLSPEQQRAEILSHYRSGFPVK